MLILALLVAVVGSACPDDESTTPTPGDTTITPTIEVLDVLAPSPWLAGTQLVLNARGADLQLRHELVLRSAAAEVVLPQIEGESDLIFELGNRDVVDLGTGDVSLDIILREGEADSAPLALTQAIAESIPVTLTETLPTTAFRNDEVVLRGSGFLAASEGTIEIEIVGTFAADGGGDPVMVSTQLPVALVERFSRDRGIVRLSTAVGGMLPGTFEGTATLVSAPRAGSRSISSAVPSTIVFQPPTIFELVSADLHLGEITTFRGGGFLGAPGDLDEATVLRFLGTWSNRDNTRSEFDREAVVTYLDGQTVLFGIEADTLGQRLVSEFFGDTSGTFAGTVTPIVISGTDDYVGLGTQVEINLLGPQQFVQVSFLASFYDSLRHYGLASASIQVQAQALSRMEGVYADYSVWFATEVPDNILPSAVSRLEIGGPDPNGLGLLGYDNTPGKDVGNLRLFDTVGGTNAETQQDGYPGYGGVFIESFLYWSEDPGLPGSRPLGAPPPDPLFDQVFGSVRSTPATLEEAQGQGEAGRVADVQLALQVLGNIVGETSAHEIGHSLGLAQPYGPIDAYHSLTPGEGCLMDSGSERPFGERAGMVDFAPTRFCSDESVYLGEILPAGR